MYRVRLGDIVFPLPPEHITCTRKSRNRTVDLLDGSQAVIQRKPSLREYTLKFMLPSREYAFSAYENGFVAPHVICEEIEALARERKTVQLVIERGAHLETAYVCVQDVTGTQSASDGEDVFLTLVLFEVTTTARYGVYAVKTAHTVSVGETLRTIAKRYYGDERMWTKLYGANLNAIEAAAKKNGYPDSRLGERIFAGTVLILPQEVAV